MSFPFGRATGNGAIDLSVAGQGVQRRDSARATVIRLALTALLLVNVAGLALYEFATYRLQFHSDSAVKSIFAEQVFRSGSLFPSDWAYAYGDLMVFFGHLFIVPLLPFIENGFALHALSGAIMAALLLGSVWWLTGMLSLSLPIRLLGLCLFSSGISPFFAENYFGQASYGPVAILLLVHFGLAICAFDAAQHSSLRRQRTTSLALAVLAFVSFLGNPERALVTYVLPLVAAAASVLVTPGWPWKHKAWPLPASFTMPVGGYAAGAVIGTVLHAYVLTRAIAVAMSERKGLLVPLQALGEKVALAAQSVLYLFGAESDPGRSIASSGGVFLLLHLALTFAVLAASISLAGTRLSSPAQRLPRALGNAFLASLLITAFLYIFTNISQTVFTSRYFVPVFTLGLIALLAFLDGNLPRGRGGIWSLAILGTVIGVSALSYETYYAPFYRATHGTASRWPASPYDGLVSFLEKNRLTYGYGSYWNSHVNTVLSGGKVVVRPVRFAILPQPMYHLSAPSWYLSPTHAGPVFLLVSRSEAAAFDPNEMKRVAGAPEKVLTYEDFTIYVYASNFITRLAKGWDAEFSPSTLHMIGRYVSKDPREGWMESAPGESGVLAYGPYISLPRGRYIADFDVSTCSSQAPSPGYVDVTGLIGGTVAELSRREIPSAPEWTRHSLTFALSTFTELMEFRVIASGAACLRARGVRVRRSD